MNVFVRFFVFENLVRFFIIIRILYVIFIFEKYKFVKYICVKINYFVRR